MLNIGNRRFALALVVAIFAGCENMATWTNGTAGDVTETDFIHIVDFTEISTANDRRRLMRYLASHTYNTIDGTEFVTDDDVEELREYLENAVTDTGNLGGTPPSPTSCQWLWPVAGGDENDVIVLTGAGAGQIELFDEMNGGSDWTDSSLSGTSFIKKVHMNELRWAIEKITRGRWKMPFYFSAGIFSAMPDMPWMGEAIGNNGINELRSLGNALITLGSLGLTDVTVRSSSRVYLNADVNCDVEIYRCKRPILFASDPPTWNEYDPSASLSWATAGCSGAADRALIGSMSLTANVENSITGATVASELQAMIDGAEQNFMVRRTDTSSATIGITGRVMIEFDVDVPPN